MPAQIPKSRPVILVADDEPLVRQFVRLALETSGYNVMLAVDGADALDRSRGFAGDIDLLLSDIKMPNLKGPELAQALLLERPRLRVRLMTGKSSGAIPEQWRRTLLRKPFAAPALIQTVREALAEA